MPSARILLGILVVLAGLWTGAASRAGEVVVGARSDQIGLNGHFDHVIDPTRTADVNRMSQADIAWDQAGRQSFGYNRQVHWFRLTLRRDHAAPAEWILRLGRPFLDEVTVFVGEDGDTRRWRQVALGDHVSAALRPIRDRLFDLDLTLPDDRSVPVLVRITSTSSVLLDAQLVTPQRLAEQRGSESLLFGLFFGALGVLVLLHLTLGSWIGDRAHVLYGAFALTQFMIYLFADGYGPLIFDLGWPALADRVQSFCNFLGGALATAMWMYVLRTKENHPLFHRAAQVLTGFYLILAIVGWGEAYTLAAPLAVPFNIAGMVVALVLSFQQLRQSPGSGPLWFYTLAVAVVAVGFLFHVSSILGLTSADGMPENILQISALAHMALLSIGLIYRIRHLERQHAAARALAAEAAARADGQRALVAMLSHEFRTPLATIHSAAQMVRFRQPELEDSSNQRLERIEDTARALSALIDVFLAGEALNQGRFALDRRRCDIADLVSWVLRLLGPQAGRVVVAPFPQVDIDADRQLVAVALRNCLANALAYSPDDAPVRLDVTAANGRIDFVVTDNGPGMNAADLKKVGTPFFRGSASAGTTGSGLGLSMIRTIAQAHGGHMTIDSVLGQGTMVTLSLPLAAAEPDRQTQPAPLQTPMAAPA